MTWVRLDDRFRTHPKVLRAGARAAFLWICGLAYSAEHLTDGLIPTAALHALVPEFRDAKKLATALVDVGLWERTEAGFIIHDYADWQPSADTVRARREEVSAKRRAAGAAGARNRWARGSDRDRTTDGKPDDNRMANAMANEWQTAQQTDGNGMAPSPSPSPFREEIPPRPARAEPGSVSPSEPVPGWFRDACGSVELTTGESLAVGECWLRYAGHRAGKADKRPGHDDAVYWLTTAVVADLRRERQRGRSPAPPQAERPRPVAVVSARAPDPAPEDRVTAADVETAVADFTADAPSFGTAPRGAQGAR